MGIEKHLTITGTSTVSWKDAVVQAVAEASKDGTYLSLDDFRQRTKASKTVIDTMVELGILADLPASNQLSLFDF